LNNPNELIMQKLNSYKKNNLPKSSEENENRRLIILLSTILLLLLIGIIYLSGGITNFLNKIF